ncbi:unnamed protein product, partial [Amoebophrya sp. A25]
KIQAQQETDNDIKATKSEDEVAAGGRGPRCSLDHGAESKSHENSSCHETRQEKQEQEEQRALGSSSSSIENIVRDMEPPSASGSSATTVDILGQTSARGRSSSASNHDGDSTSRSSIPEHAYFAVPIDAAAATDNSTSSMMNIKYNNHVHEHER